MFKFLGRMAVTHPWKILLAWVALAAGLMIFAPQWETKAHDDDIRFLPDRCQSVRGYKLLEKAFPQELFACRVLFALERSDRPLNDTDYALIDKLVADLEKLRTDEPDLQIGKIVSCRDSLIGRRLTSNDGKCTLIQAALGTPYLAVQTHATVQRAEAVLLDRIHEAGTNTPELLTTGPAGIGRDLMEAGGNCLEKTTLATVVLVVVILLFVYRAPLLALIPLATIALSVCVALRLLSLVTLLPGIHLVNISQVFAVVMLYGAGTDYCLFLISRYREELEGGQPRDMAICRSVKSVGGALAASAGTVICGLSLMGFAEFAKVRCAGPAIALALGVALAASLTLTPALLRLFGNAVFWPRKLKHVGSQPQLLSLGGVKGGGWGGNSFWDWISRKVAARPFLVWSVSLLILLPLCIIGLNTTPVCKPTGELSPMSASIRGLDAIQRHFTAGETGPVTVLLVSSADWNSPEGRQLIGEVSLGLGHLDNVAEVRSLTQPLGTGLPAPREGGVKLLDGLLKSLRRDVSGALVQAQHAARDFYVASVKNEDETQYVTRLDVVLKSEPFEAASRATLTDIEDWLTRELPRTSAPMGWVQPEFYGTTVNSRDLAEVTHSDRIRVNVLVMGGIFIILVVLVRKAWLAAYLLATVLVSYFATLGATAIVSSFFTTAYPLGQMDWRVPFFLFTILAAVGEDYNILLVSRILQERRRRGAVEGIRYGLSRTGATITACGVIMAGTFATLMLGGLNTLIQIGFALAFGVILDTFIVRPFLVPAFLMMVWGRGEKVNKAEVREKPPLAA